MTENYLKFVNRQELVKMGISFSNPHLLSMEKLNLFPQRRYLSPQKPIWIYDEIQAYLESRLNLRNGGKNV